MLNEGCRIGRNDLRTGGRLHRNFQWRKCQATDGLRSRQNIEWISIHPLQG